MPKKRWKGKYTDVLRGTRDALLGSVVSTETAKLIVASLVRKIDKALGCEGSSAQIGRPSYSRLVQNEFSDFAVSEFTSSPFGMTVFGPALYILASELVSPQHPFSLYCIKELMEVIRDDKRSWGLHSKIKRSERACSYVTALGMLTIAVWLKQVRLHGFQSGKLVPAMLRMEEVKTMVKNSAKQVSVFVSYSSSDESAVTMIVDRLKSIGYEVTFASYDLTLGDSRPGFIL